MSKHTSKKYSRKRKSGGRKKSIWSGLFKSTRRKKLFGIF